MAGKSTIMDMDTTDIRFSDKLTQFMKKVLNGNVDQLYLHQVLTMITDVHEKTNFEPVIELIIQNCDTWLALRHPPTLLSFIVAVCGLGFRNEALFVHSCCSRLDEFILDHQYFNHECSIVRLSYVQAKTSLTCHPAGNAYIRKRKLWADAVGYAKDDDSIYVTRQGVLFLNLFLKANISFYDDCKECVGSIVMPIIQQLQKETIETPAKLTRAMRLLNQLMDECVTTANANLVPEILINDFGYDAVLEKAAEDCNNVQILDVIAESYSKLILSGLSNDADSSKQVGKIMEMYRFLIKAKKMGAILTFSRSNHMLWVRLRARRPNADSKIEMHFYIMQLSPLLVSLRHPENSSVLDTFCNKLLDSVSEETFRMAYAAKELIRQDKIEKPLVLMFRATTVVQSLLEYHSLMERDAVVITFQTLTWVLKNFVPTSCEDESAPDENEIMDARNLCNTGQTLLNAVLNGLCTLLQAYKINWNEAFEGLCLLKLCHWLLDNPDLTTKHVVLTLKIIQLNIEQCMPPSMVLCVDRIEGTSLEAIGPLLNNKLHDTRWEIRDSALEVIAVIANLALDKCPAFADWLIDLGCPNVALAILEFDAESYVRASAIKALTAMIRVDRIWNDCLASTNIGKLVQKVLRTDTEAIVRREAVILLNTLLTARRLDCTSFAEHVKTMLYLMMNDLHWEVRVNTLCYWSDVIDMELERQGMVDGVFPLVTFAHESKKIITLTKKEIQIRLNRALGFLSKYGCLNALLLALFDECDEEVVDKGSEVVLKLVKLLREFQLLPVDEACVAKKRKADTENSNELLNNGPGQPMSEGNSEMVIDSIINSTDLSLLTNVIGDASRTQPEVKNVEMLSPEEFMTRLQDWHPAEKNVTDRIGDLTVLMDTLLSLNHENIDAENVPDCY